MSPPLLLFFLTLGLSAEPLRLLKAPKLTLILSLSTSQTQGKENCDLASLPEPAASVPSHTHPGLRARPSVSVKSSFLTHCPALLGSPWFSTQTTSGSIWGTPESLPEVGQGSSHLQAPTPRTCWKLCSGKAHTSKTTSRL